MGALAPLSLGARSVSVLQILGTDLRVYKSEEKCYASALYWPLIGQLIGLFEEPWIFPSESPNSIST